MKKQRVLAYAPIRPSSNSFPTSPQKEKKILGEDGDHEEEEEHEEEDSKKKNKTKKKTRASLTDPGIVETARGHFRVDHAFGEDATQRDVWDAIGEPALTDVMRGEEACVIAYGQTGAGKTYALLNTPGMTSSMGGGLEKDFTSRRREEEEEGEEDDDDDDEEEEEEEEERRNSAGLVPRLAVELFLRIDKEGKKKKVMKETKKNRRTKTTFVVEISMMQIYNEIVDDLLEDLEDGGNSATKKKMSDKSKRSASVSFNEKNGKTSRTKNVVRMNDVCNNNNNNSINNNHGEEWEVEDLTWMRCENASMLLQKFAEGRKRLRYAETRMNKHSSRSHCVLNVRVKKIKRKKRGRGKDAVLIVEQSEGVLTVVDLAGSERQHKDYYRHQEVKRYPLVNKKDRVLLEELRFKEATRINQSLLALGNCVRALASNAAHVPVRDSNLTKILCSSLNGRSRTWLLVCCSSEVEHASETAAALDFATRAMRVETLARCPGHTKEIIEIDSAELSSTTTVLSTTPRESNASRSSTSSSITNGTLNSDREEDDSFDDDNDDDDDKNFDRKEGSFDQRELNERKEDQRQRCTLQEEHRRHRRPFTTNVREGKLRREIQSLRDELESLKIERAVAKQRAKENDERKGEELESMKAKLNEKCSEVSHSLKAMQRENREKGELVESLQKEKNVLLAKYREKCRQFDVESQKAQTILDRETRAKRIAESNHEREVILHTETRRNLERERTKSEKVVARCAAERLKSEANHQARLQTLLEKNERTRKEAEVNVKTLRLYHEAIKPSGIIKITRVEDEKDFARRLSIEQRKDAQRALQFRALRDDFTTKLVEKNKLLENEKRRSQRSRLHALEMKEKLKAVSKSLTDFKLAQREGMDEICARGVVVYKRGDKNSNPNRAYERVVRVASPLKTSNAHISAPSQYRVLQQGYVRWNASKTIPSRRLERIGLDNSNFLLRQLKRNLKRAQFAPFSFEEEEEEDKEDKEDKDEEDKEGLTPSFSHRRI